MKTRKGFLERRGKIFYAVWHVSGKRFVKSTGQADRRDAEKVLAQFIRPYLVEDEIRTLETVKARIEGAKGELAALDEKEHPPLTLDRAWHAFEVNPNRPDSGDSTLKQYNAELRRFMKWLSAKHPAISAMRDVTPRYAAEYAQALNAANISASTYNQHIGFLRLLWRILKKEARADENPWDEIRRKHLTVSSRRELTVEELRRLCSTATGEMRVLLAIGVYSGLRLGDAATLRWGETDLKRNLIMRVPMKVARRRDKPVVIPIHGTLRAMLAEIPGSARKEYVLPEMAALYARDSSALCKKIQAHFADNAIQTTRDTGKGRAAMITGYHALRYTFVSMCRELGAPLSVVESIVGHASPAMTRHYTHTSEQAAAAAVNLLPAVLGDTPAPALPPVKMIDAAPIRALAESLTGKNWREVKAEILALT